MLAEHQIEAVARIGGIMESIGGAVLADEPGLGKSFVAASFARDEQTEGATIELIVPASLRKQWGETLTAFGVTARMLTHDGIITDPFFPEPRRRLVVVDEAHAFRNPGTQRYAALARHSAGARVLLITATPICNRAADLKSLIDIVAADDALSCRGVPSIDVAFETGDVAMMAAIVSAIVIRRSRAHLPDELQFGSLNRRVIRHTVGSAGIDDLRFPLVASSAIVKQFLWRRLESSEAALVESLRRQRRFYERALECLASGRSLPKREYRRVFVHEEDAAAFQTVLFWEAFVPDDITASAGDIEDEIRKIDASVRDVSARPSAKRDALMELCLSSPEPLLIFTGWAATAADLYLAIRTRRRAALVTGRKPAAAADAIDAFRAGHVDVLVSTDLAAEGLNLQRAGVVVHYDIPWNPVKLEQREGRAYRIGQRRTAVEAVYFLPAERKSGIVPVMTRKNRERRRLLGAKQTLPPLVPALRPRVSASASVTAFIRAVESSGWSVPPELLRRHRAGFEQLLGSLSHEYLDAARLGDLAALAHFEPWGRSLPFSFAHL